MPKRIVSQCLMQRMPACRVAGLPGCHTQGIGRECPLAGLPGCRVAEICHPSRPALAYPSVEVVNSRSLEYPSVEVVARIGVA